MGFEYVPGHPVLEGVDLTVRPGERVAIVGASGAGKSTLAKLVAGIHRPTRGGIRIGGQDLEDLGSPVAAGLVALVTQEVHTFAGRLADDLRLARPGATRKELWAALDLVGAREWAKGLDAGSTRSSGRAGSGSPRPRPSSWRWPASSWPTRRWPSSTKRPPRPAAPAPGCWRQALDASPQGRTAIVVAHRLTQAVAADRVVVLDRGRVVETGTHEQLARRRRPLRRPVDRLVRKPSSRLLLTVERHRSENRDATDRL